MKRQTLFIFWFEYFGSLFDDFLIFGTAAFLTMPYLRAKIRWSGFDGSLCDYRCFVKLFCNGVWYGLRSAKGQKRVADLLTCVVRRVLVWTTEGVQAAREDEWNTSFLLLLFRRRPSLWAIYIRDGCISTSLRWRPIWLFGLADISRLIGSWLWFLILCDWGSRQSRSSLAVQGLRSLSTENFGIPNIVFLPSYVREGVSG